MGRRRRRILLGIAIPLIVIVVLVAVAEIGGRAWAQERIRTQVASALDQDPASVDATVGGGSIIVQALQGALGRVDVGVDDAHLDALSGDLAITAEGVPLDTSQPVDSLTAGVTLGPDAVTDLVRQAPALAEADVAFGDDDLTVSTSTTVLGISVPVKLALTPSVDGGAIVLTPSRISVGGADFDLDGLRASRWAGLVDTIAAPQSICVAEYLPSSLALDSVSVRSDAAVVTVRGEHVVLDELSSAPKGHC